MNLSDETSATALGELPGPQLPFFLFRFMAIDVGSNSIKYRIWEIEADGAVRQLAEQRFAVRLGTGVFTAGQLGEEAVEATLEAFRQIRKDFQNQQVHALRAVATSAMREASDGLAVARRVQRETGINLHILPAAEEARMIALGALGTRPSLPAGQHVLIDIGGGSSEVIIVREPDIVLAESVRLGAVRLKEWFFPEIPPRPEHLDLAEQHIADVIGKALHVPPPMASATGWAWRERSPRWRKWRSGSRPARPARGSHADADAVGVDHSGASGDAAGSDHGAL